MKKRQLTPLDLMKAEQPTQYRSSAEIEYLDRQKSEAKERAKQIAQNDERVKNFYGQSGQELMTYHVCTKDDYSTLTQGPNEPDAGAEFIRQMTAEGWELSTNTLQVVGQYCESQSKFHGAGLTVANLRRGFDRLRQLGCIDLIEPAATPAPEPEAPEQKPLSVDEILAKADGSRESDLQIRREINRIVQQDEFGKIFEDWHRSVYEHWGVLMTRKHHEKAWQFIRNHDQELNPLLPSAYDAARRELNRIGLLDCWTNREWLERQYAREELRDWEFKREMNLHTINGTLNDARARA